MSINKYNPGSVEQLQLQQLALINYTTGFKKFINWNRICDTFDIKDKTEEWQGDVFIAGGALTSYFSNRPLSDVDIFFENELDYNFAVKAFEDRWRDVTNPSVKGVHLNAKTFDINRLQNHPKSMPIPREKILIQLICKTRTLTETLDSFDFTVCKAAFSLIKGEFYFHPNFLLDLNTNKLVLDGKYSPVTALYRVLKYQKKGFEIENLEMAKLVMGINRLELKTNKDALEHFKGVYITKPVYGLVQELEKNPDAPFNLTSLQVIEENKSKKKFAAFPIKKATATDPIDELFSVSKPVAHYPSAGLASSI